MGKVQPDTLRIGHVNIGGIGQKACQSKCRVDEKCKQCELRGFLATNRFDIAGITECNVNWNSVDVQDRLPERTRGWFEGLHINTAHYSGDPIKSPNQYGGVSVWSIGKASHRVMEHGQDPEKLGRWAWTRYRGREGVGLRFVSAYRPVHNKTGVRSVWSQQKMHFQDKSDDVDPLEAFKQQFKEEAEKWLLSGDQIVIGIDANEDIRLPGENSLTSQLQQLGLVEACITRHGLLGPATHENGSDVIDGLFVSSTLLGLRCGYMNSLADHRLLWIDIPTSIAFGYAVPRIVTAEARRLQCRDPRIVKAYHKEYIRLLHASDMEARLEILYNSAVHYAEIKEPLPSWLAEEWEKIDQFQVATMKQAERQCRKFRTGEVEWSPTFQAACKKRDFLFLLVKKRKGGRVTSRYLRRKAKSAEMLEALRWTLEEAEQARTLHYEILRKCKRDASTSRTTYLRSLAEARAGTKGPQAEREIINLMNREKIRREWRQIRYAEGKLQGSGVSMVIAPDENNIWTEKTDKQDIERAVFQEAKERFNQASATPFLNSPLLELVGPLGTGPAAEEILDGTFQIPPEVDQYTAKFIKQLKRPPEAVPMSIDVSLKTYQQGWKKARENTAAGPSGLHFGHFKAGALDPIIANFEYLMSHIPYFTGYSPKRWQKAIDYLLLKKQGVFLVNKLRIILFFEADKNQNNKRLGRDMNYGAEKAGTLAPEQYGSRKNLSAIDHCLNKQLTLDLARLKKVPLALCSNDAKGCYDRIVHSVASLCMQRQGVPTQPIICMFVTIQNLEHHVRTVYGISEEFYKGETELWAVPVSTIGQGNGCGPQTWAVVSTPVLNMLRKEGFGVYFRTAITRNTIQFVAYAFVDDTDLCTTLKDPAATGQEVARTMQETLNHWEGGLRATGGAIEPSKTYWYLMDFKWNAAGEWSYKTERECPAKLEVRDSDGMIQTLERLPPSEARRTLGAYLAPDGNQNEQVRVLQEKAKAWAEKIRTGHLPRHLVWRALKLSIIKGLQYPLTATMLTEKECKMVLSAALTAALPRSGIFRNMPRVVIHGPKQYQGFGVPNLYTLQGTAHTSVLISRGYREDHFNGQLLTANIEQAKLELGMKGSVLTHDYAKHGHLLTRSWIKNTWQFLSENKMTIEDASPDTVKRREQDSLLMETFVANGYKDQELRTLNLCRLFLQVATLSDIVTGCGTKVTAPAWEGKIDKTAASPYTWPNQGRPGPAAWKKWQEALTKILSLRGQRQLRNPLGRWFHNETQCQWFYEPQEVRLYQKVQVGEETSWKYYPKRIGSRSTRNAVLTFEHGSTTESCPSTAKRATVMQQRSWFTLTGYGEAIPQPPVSNQTLKDRLDRVHEDAQWAVEGITLPDDEAKGIAQAIKDHKCIAVSDGSFKPDTGLGTAAFVIQGATRAGRITGDCVTPGYDTDQSAYRSEASGLYAIVMTIKTICDQYKIKEGTVELACDGKDALLDTMDPYRKIDSQKEHFDLLLATRALLKSCPITWKHRHVYGHQDDNARKVLNQWETLNVEMDTNAKKRLKTVQDSGGIALENRQIRIFQEPWPLWIEGRKASRSIAPLISNQVDGKPLLEYWKKKGKIGTAEAPDVDWSAIERAVKAIPEKRQIWVSKHVSTFCGTGVNMKRWKKRDNSQCPRCAADEEDTSHVWKCQSPETNTTWEDAMDRLDEWMEKEKTNPIIATAISVGLRQWRNNSRSVHEDEAVQTTIETQDHIGWEAMLEGRLATTWHRAQEAHYRTIPKCRKTGRRWTTSIIKKLWDIAWELWDQRNRVLHDSENSEERQELAKQIEDQFNLGHARLSLDVQNLFRPGIENLKKRSSDQQQAWVRRVSLARERALTQPQEQAVQRQQTLMSDWLAGRTRTRMHN